MADTISISELPSGTPTNSGKLVFVDPVDGVTKQTPASDLPNIPATDVTYDNTTSLLSATNTQQAIDELASEKANDSGVVHDTGNETIAGIKTFSSSPIVPTPTTATQAVNKEYADYTADFYKYSITTSVASGNLTVALKNYEGNDPTPTKPVKIQIGGVIRTISGALSCPVYSASNALNLGSAELATKEADIFVHLYWYDTATPARVGLCISRLPTVTDMSVTYTNEKGVYIDYDGSHLPSATTPVVNIGRFNATLSAGGAYTWSIGTSVIINSPIYETRYPITSNWTPTLTWTGTTAPTGGTNLTYNYQIIGSKCYIRGSGYNMTAGLNNTRLVVSLPFGAIGTAANIALIPAQVSSSNVPNTCYGDINYNDIKLSITFATANVTYFNFQGYYNI